MALAVAPIDTNNAVVVVPILAPIIAEAVSWNGKLILIATDKIIAITAAEDCIKIVKTNPANKKIKIDKIHFPVNSAKGIIFSIQLNTACKYSIPINKSPNPVKIQPISQIFFFERIFNIIHKPIIGNAKAETLYFIPISAIIQVEAVLQTFAPKISQSEFAKAKIPAFTKPIVNIVVVLEDCKIAVDKNPAKNALNLLFVAFSKKLTSIGQLTALIPSVIMLIPNRNKPIHPNNCPKLKSIKFF